MKTPRNDNRGATLIELISSIAILSIIGICCSMLLMFSIKTNNYILTGTSAYKDASLLNDRLEQVFANATIVIDDTGNTVESSDENTDEITDEIESVWLDLGGETPVELKLVGSSSCQGDAVLQDYIDDLSFKLYQDAGLVRVRYTIGSSRNIEKVFPCKFQLKSNESS